jgi:hypothetical protein
MTDTAHSFDLDAVLAEPNPILVATNRPTVCPMSYQWEAGCFWPREPGPAGAVWLRIEPKSLKTFNFGYATSPYVAEALEAQLEFMILIVLVITENGA